MLSMPGISLSVAESRHCWFGFSSPKFFAKLSGSTEVTLWAGALLCHPPSLAPCISQAAKPAV